ncbi:tetratricopeptide repeat protein [Chitinophaga sp. YIM B06452]|uniref:tetratricopeptide repeat protein n=1 Tax=Chitinophaga sp. YIM B06452 TaxID=3082158 RepID=UPI0031FEBB31
MNNDSPRQERILKIFTPVRCINRDQLLRYHRGNMTAVEKHLVEQHIVDCDLCHDALQAMGNHHLHEQYSHLTHELSQFIHREFAPPPQPDKKQQQRQIRQHKTAESLLSYFWAIMFVAIGGGSVFLLQQHLKNRPALAALPARTSEALVIPAPAAPPAAAVDPNYPATQTNDGKPLVIHTQYNSSARDSINKNDSTTISAANIKPIKPAPKDSASLKKKAVKDSTPKTSAADTNARLALNTPATLKEDPKKTEPKDPKDQKYTAEESNNTPNQAETDKNINPANTSNNTGKSKEKEEKAPASGDESLFRAAMQYQQQGDMNEAINQFKKLSGNEKYSERAKYQLAMIYKNKGQNGKARRLFKEIIKMEGNMKSMAQAQLNNMN